MDFFSSTSWWGTIKTGEELLSFEQQKASICRFWTFVWTFKTFVWTFVNWSTKTSICRFRNDLCIESPTLPRLVPAASWPPTSSDLCSARKPWRAFSQSTTGRWTVEHRYTCNTLFLTAIWNVSLSSLAVEYATLRYLPYAIWTHQKSSNIRFANIILFDIFDDMWLIFHLSLGLPGLRPDCNSSILVEPMFSKIVYFNK